MRQQIDKEFCVVETAGVAAIIGAADLTYYLLDLGKFGERPAGLPGERHARRRTGARSQRAANPDRAFIEMRQELGTNYAAESQEQHHRERGHAHPQRDLHVVEAPVKLAAIAFLEPVENGVSPLF